jgi:trigger factor
METKITQKSSIITMVETTIPWEKIEKAYKKTFREISNMVVIPGFRKGHAPAALLKKKYREDIVTSLAKNQIPEFYSKILEEHSINAVGEPQITDYSLKEKESFSFSFLQEVIPEIELKEWKGIELESLKVKVTDEMVENRINSMLQQRAKKEEIKDEHAREGDTIKFQFTVMTNSDHEILFDENFTEPLTEDFPYPTIKDEIMKVNSGDDIELNMIAPDDFEVEAARGKDVKLFIEIQSITREDKPELNEEFAKAEGSDSIDAFKEKIQKELFDQAADMEKNRVIAAIIEKIVADYDFEAPYSLVNDHLKYLANTEMGPYLQYLPDEHQKQELIKQFFETRRAGADLYIRANIILDKLAEVEGIAIEDDELKAKLVELIEYLPEDQKSQVDTEDIKSPLADRVREDMIQEKARELVYDSAKLTLVDELTPPPVPEPEPKPDDEKDQTESDPDTSDTPSEKDKED